MKIFLFVMDLVGPQNACIGMAQELKGRGHEIYFLTTEKFAPSFEKYGLGTFHLVHENVESSGGKEIKAFTDRLFQTGMMTNSSPIEKVYHLRKLKLPRQFKLASEYEPQMKCLIGREKPDLIIVDSEVMPPCLMNSNIPWVYLYCSNPLGILQSDDLPPFLSDFGIDSDKQKWKEFGEIAQKEFFDYVVDYQRQLCQMFKYPFIENQKFIPRSTYLNIYQFPKELSYEDVITIPSTLFRVDAFCRNESSLFELPADFKSKLKPTDKLIYVSLGSMGSSDVDLMKRIVDVLSKTPYYYIVSKGIRHSEYELADNMWGGQFLPQTKILPLVDLVIIHGGNNTLTEAIYYGKPMIVMPLFYDQYNNAQRVHEKQFGIQLRPYCFTEMELVHSIETLLNNKEINLKLKTAAKRIQTSQSKTKACVAIESLVVKK